MQTTEATADAASILSPNSKLMEQTRELCQTIIDHPDYQGHMDNIKAFLADESAKSSYRSLSEQGEAMQRKQRAGELTPEDIMQFERVQSSVKESPLVAGFLAAQDSLNEIHGSISKQVAKTLELGRLPLPEDLEDSGGCCGGGSCGSEGGC